MEFTQQDTKALYQIWMSQKAKMRVTQMEMAKQLNLSQRDFSAMIRGALPLTMTFVSQFCAQMHVDPKLVLPSLRSTDGDATKVVYLKTAMTIDGEIQRAYIEGNQVIVEYAHTVAQL
ncbi:XRE family transcriptional regulator [Vibrio astriarenae]|uniref:XRE family transcriptional regulator n=1 Tax=Vibrio astriarenae TaxID=1481923 RepID=A0A7Z2T2C4_9VIBR|nr:XRE family transcriptional regulator [Vibrio astriarenae]QIA63060.1 XRE family transcriptional regulator [Vibrio astriarenae]